MNRRRPTKSVATVATIPKTPLPSPFQSAPSFASVAKQGFSWGIGNALAHTVINRMMGPAVAEPINTKPTPVAYTQCLKDFGDAESCKHLLE